jgi:hypothetical protein
MDLLKKLFPSGRPVSVHEVYKPSEQDTRQLDQWLDGDRLTMINRLVLDMVNGISAAGKDAALQYFQHQMTNCVVLKAIDPISQDDMLPLYLHYSTKVKELGYRMVNRDVMRKEQGKEVQTILKAYLKPPMSFDIPIDQLFGNVLLELFKLNNYYQHLKITVSGYSDRKYQQPEPYEAFVSEVFG